MLRSIAVRILAPTLFAAAAIGPVVGPTAPAAQANTADNTIRVINHNTDAGGHASALAAGADWAGEEDVYTFQELCESEADALRAAGWNVMWRQQNVEHCGGGAKGNAIVTKRTLSNEDVVWLNVGLDAPTRAGRDFKLLCADLTGVGVANTRVCTTHLALDYNGDAPPSGPETRANQVQVIANHLNPQVAAGKRLILTCDCNNIPNDTVLNPLYRVQGNGFDTDRFWEGDQMTGSLCGAGNLCRNMLPTTDDGRKLDYFFTSWRGVDPRNGLSKGIVPSPTAGHHIIRGEVTFGAI